MKFLILYLATAAHAGGGYDNDGAGGGFCTTLWEIMLGAFWGAACVVAPLVVLGIIVMALEKLSTIKPPGGPK